MLRRHLLLRFMRFKRMRKCLEMCLLNRPLIHLLQRTMLRMCIRLLLLMSLSL